MKNSMEPLCVLATRKMCYIAYANVYDHDVTNDNPLYTLGIYDWYTKSLMEQIREHGWENAELCARKYLNSLTDNRGRK